MNMKKYLAELLGAFTLVFMGCGAAMVLGAATPGGHLGIALAFGLAIVAMAHTIGGVSGCHINPAVSLSMFLDKRLSGTDFVGYVVAQLVGAVIAGALLSALYASSVMPDLTGGLGSNGIAGAGGVGGALLIEVILTFIFVLTILSVTANEKLANVAGLVIALTLMFVIIFGLPLTGVSVNPVRSIGPALFAGGYAMADLWVFIVAPLIGSVLAFVVYRGLIKE